VPDTIEFLAAIRARDAAAVERMLAEDPTLAMARDRDGFSAVMLARYFSWSDTTMVDLLVNARGDADLDIFEASATGRAGRVRELLAGTSASRRATRRTGSSRSTWRPSSVRRR